MGLFAISPFVLTDGLRIRTTGGTGSGSWRVVSPRKGKTVPEIFGGSRRPVDTGSETLHEQSAFMRTSISF